MIIRKLENIANLQLSKAIVAMNNKFISCYVDPVGGCAVSFKGEISEKKIQKFFSFLGDDTVTVYGYDYEYNNDNTNIFTKDGWKY